MLSNERQQIKDVLDFIIDDGRFRQNEKIGSAVEPQRIANKLESFGALVPVSHGMKGKQWYITESGQELHGFLISEAIENPELRQDNYLLSQWALLTSVSRRKGRRDGELALLDIALGHSSASEDYGSNAIRLLMASGSSQSKELLRFVSGQPSRANQSETRFASAENDDKLYTFSVKMNSDDLAIFKRVRADMEHSEGYVKGQLSNKDIVLIMAMAWMQLRGL